VGRKNSRVQRSKTPRRYRPTDAPKRAPLPPIPIEATVVPKGRCYLRSRTGKLRFTREQVDTALRHAQHNRAIKGSGKREERYYQCDETGGCGDWHLTSRSEWKPKTA
jgi:hypothetical protein